MNRAKQAVVDNAEIWRSNIWFRATLIWLAAWYVISLVVITVHGKSPATYNAPPKVAVRLALGSVKDIGAFALGAIGLYKENRARRLATSEQLGESSFDD